MRYPVLSTTIIVLLAVSAARSGEEPQAIIARAVQAQGGAANLSRARAVQTKIKGTYYDPSVKESLVDGAKFVGELITQLPTQVKLSIDADAAGMRISLTSVLNGRKSWTRDFESSRADDPATFADFELSAYADHVSSLVPLLKDDSYRTSSAGESQVHEQSALAVKVASKGRPDITLYFDKVSGLLLKTEYRRRDPSTNQEVKREEFFSDYQEVNPLRTEEQTLKAANVGTDDSTLLELLRKQILSDETRSKTKEYVRGLSDPSFQVRQRATENLIAQGTKAIPLLTQALKDRDPEVAGLAKECLDTIGRPDSAVTLAAVRLLAMRKPAGAAEVLLSYLPSALDEAVAREVRAALAAVALRDGKPDKVLLDALKDKDPERRSAAAALVGPGKNPEDVFGQRLLLPGVKRAMKSAVYQDKKKVMEFEVSDIQIFNKLDDSVFAKP
jgi:hypothetical protein